MEIVIFKGYDTSLMGDAEFYLRDPRVRSIASTPGVPFDPARKQQLWAYPTPVDVDAFQLKVSADGTSARLVDYFIPAAVSASPNIQDNPTKDGYVAQASKFPLRDLAADEKLVLVRRNVGSLSVDSWWVRKGEPVSAPAPTDDVFTNYDRQLLVKILEKVSR